MTTALESDLVISYEGAGDVTELMGGTQANFLVRRPAHAAREVAVLLNSGAAAALAKELDATNDEHFRENAARIAGRVAVEHMFERFNRLDSIIFLSAASLREDPEIVAEVKRVLAAAQAMAAAAAAHDSHDDHGDHPAPVDHDRMAPQH